MNRRSFLSWLGVAGAAPAMAPEILNPASEANTMSSLGMPMATGDFELREEARKLLEKKIDESYLGKLARIARGEVNEKDLLTLRTRSIVENAYRSADCGRLKSISDAGREWITERRSDEARKQMLIDEATEILDRYDSTGILKRVYTISQDIELELRERFDNEFKDRP